MKPLKEVYDNQLKKILLVNPRYALHLAISYPNRFSYKNSTIQQEKENMSPAIPPEREKLTNGTYNLIAESHQTTKGQYGDQEEISCINEATGVHTTVWIPHNSRTKILAAIDAKLAIMQGDEWQIMDGSPFRVVVAGGKVVAILPPENKI